MYHWKTSCQENLAVTQKTILPAVRMDACVVVRIILVPFLYCDIYLVVIGNNLLIHIVVIGIFPTGIAEYGLYS